MNILVLGNGFDLAHGLPTTYKDFLDFADAFADFAKRNSSTYYPPKGKERFLPYFTTLVNENMPIYNELRALIQDNVWLRHFNAVYESRKRDGKDGWIDFESEISSAIQALDGALDDVKEYIRKGKDRGHIQPYQFEALKYLIDREKSKYDSIYLNIEYISAFKEQFLNDLNRLTRCLEIYLSDYVNNLPVSKRLPDIDGLKIDKVLSFNYTNTYERIYGKDKPDIEYDYIHGKAEINHDINSCKLVLGIDEYLIGEERNSNTEFIQFKKFFQRIYKKTGCKYMDWLKEYETNNIGKYASLEAEDLNVYIFGHSLDVTDKDIMRRLILSEAGRMFKRDGLKAQTTIFHFNQEAMGSQIANLVKVIGQDNLISMVHGSDAKIILKRQQEVQLMDSAKE